MRPGSAGWRPSGALPNASACGAIADRDSTSSRIRAHLDEQLTGHYPAAAASHQQALALNHDVGNRLGQAETLNCLGELATRTADGHQARDRHAQALAIARQLGAPLEEARALEGIGHSHLRDGHPSEGAASLEQALAIYQRIGAPNAHRVEETLIQLRQGNLAPARNGRTAPAPER